MHDLDISALTTEDQPRGAGILRAVQYAVQRGGDVTIYGDQQWVRDGYATETGGVVLVRDVTVTYGRWRPANRPNLRVIVFWYPSPGYCGRGWTWCWEHKGVPADHAGDLPAARPTWRPVFDEATAALRARLACMTGSGPR